jgi:hypothetical protein
MAARIADELVNISGADVVVYVRTDNNYDEVWEEDPDPTYQAGKPMKAFFVPQPLAVQLTMFGQDAPNQTTAVFARDRVLTQFGKRMLRKGDIIDLPYNSVAVRPGKYRVLSAFDSGNFRYTWLYFSCLCENVVDDKALEVGHK